MKTQDRKPANLDTDSSRGNGLWSHLRNLFRRSPAVDETLLAEVRQELAVPPANPLERIQDYLSRHGLAQQVRARCATEGGGFVLEDDDGLIHAKDFTSAVAVIERTWLSQA